MRREGLDHVVNLSVNQNLGRTIITAGATFLAVLSLFILGGEVLRGFAFTMIVGIISGTYSTVFIASSIAILLSQGRRRTVASATPAATSPTGSSKAATSPSGSSKKKRAS
jgi:preprotein translocase subunit SecF